MENKNPFPVWPGQPKQGAAPSPNEIDQAAMAEMKEYCKPCRKPFKDYEALLQHKIADPKHNLCYVCKAEFKTLEAKDNHQKQWHAHQQNLKCPKCFQRFPTLGSFVYHIESEKCIVDFHEAVQDRTKVVEKMRDARNWKGSLIEDKMDGMNEEPMPALRNYAASNIRPTIVHDPQQALSITTSPTLDTVAARQLHKLAELYESEEEDLISFETSEDIAKSGWGASTAIKKVGQKTQLRSSPLAIPVPSDRRAAPANVLANEDWPVVGEATGDSLANNNNLTLKSMTPDIKPVILKALDTVDRPSFDPNTPDPKHPDFKALRYWNPYARSYKCPWKGCRKTCPSAGQFISHLKSPAHRVEKTQCSTCFNYFDTIAALAQHSSAQGKCWARHTDKFEAEVDRMTAGIATIGGKWDDDTIKYTVNRSMPLIREGMVDAHHAQVTAEAEKKAKFWDNKTPDW